MEHTQQCFQKNYFEQKAQQNGSIVCGIDEVGRGPLFGPMVLGCVILPNNLNTDLLIDSKLLSKKKLLHAEKWIKNNCLFETIMVSPWTIDAVGINKATEIGIKKLIINISNKIKQPISQILIDHVKISINHLHNIPITTAPKGESWSSSIAAASIIAKTTRDKMIENLSPIFPHYELDKHKGYGTAQHIRKIITHNRSVQHRITFCRNIKHGI